MVGLSQIDPRPSPTESASFQDIRTDSLFRTPARDAPLPHPHRLSRLRALEGSKRSTSRRHGDDASPSGRTSHRGEPGRAQARAVLRVPIACLDQSLRNAQRRRIGKLKHQTLTDRRHRQRRQTSGPRQHLHLHRYGRSRRSCKPPPDRGLLQEVPRHANKHGEDLPSPRDLLGVPSDRTRRHTPDRLGPEPHRTSFPHGQINSAYLKSFRYAVFAFNDQFSSLPHRDHPTFGHKKWAGQPVTDCHDPFRELK